MSGGGGNLVMLVPELRGMCIVCLTPHHYYHHNLTAANPPLFIACGALLPPTPRLLARAWFPLSRLLSRRVTWIVFCLRGAAFGFCFAFEPLAWDRMGI